jgi:2-amino-4-hydroxy-6-hydroxymethyldihydropteridine diphosphokinase
MTPPTDRPPTDFDQATAANSMTEATDDDTAPAPASALGAAPALSAGIVAFVGLGANLGNPKATLADAITALRDIDPALQASSFYRSTPVDALGPDFVNAVVRLETRLAPHALLDALQAIEQRFGRERPYRNAPRTLDLDLLLYAVEGDDGGLRHRDDRLEIPHPRAARRAFVLAPLADLWPGGQIPGAGRVADLLVASSADPTQRVERLPD